jgi:hypothetical protein
MGYVEGESLAQRIADGPLPPHEAAEVTKAIAEIVTFAHSRGVIHRDLKPANVLLSTKEDEGGTNAGSTEISTSALHPSFLPKLTDFGLAKRVEGDNELTATGQVIGTPSYMSPEQAAGKIDEIGTASDVYSIGATLYELLTGRRPFQAATSLDTLMQVLETDPVPPRLLNSTVPRDLQTICLKCLEKDPKSRYRSAGLLAAELGRFLSGEPIHATSVNLLRRVTRALARSERDEHFQGWGSALMAFGAIVLLAHVSIYVLEKAAYGPLAAYWLPRTAMFALMFVLFWICRPQSILPTNSAERPIWAAWIGYLLALATTNVVLSLRDAPPHELYAFSSILSGICFFIMGSHIWGGSYAIGLVFLAAAPLLTYFSDVSPILFGILWAVALSVLGVRYRRLRGALRSSRTSRGCAP